MVNGKCALCGEVKDLNKEHVPPRSAYNSKTRYYEIPSLDYIRAENSFDFKPKGRPKQGGITFYSFCNDCNSFLGSKYVTSYKNWAMAGKEVFTELEKTNQDFNLVTYDVKEVYPLRLFKSILAMFLAINSDNKLVANDEIRNFLKDPNSNQLSDKYGIYIYLNKEGALRYNGIVVKGNLSTRESLVISEITYPPYGYVLTIDSKLNNYNLPEMTSFKKYNYNTKSPIYCRLPILQTHLSYLPLDYRSKNEILDQIDKSKNLI